MSGVEPTPDPNGVPASFSDPAASPPGETHPDAAGSAPVPPAALPRRRGRLRRILTRELAYVVILGTPVALFFLTAMPRSNAMKLLKALHTVQVAHTPFHRVEQLATQFGGSAACVGDNCLFQFQNSWLHRLHLAPLTEFTVMIERGGDPHAPGGGKVAAIDMAMLVSRGWQGGAIASALVFDRAHAGPDGPYQASVRVGADGRPNRTVVRLAPGATALERTRARDFDLRCLTRIGGCQNSRELLPEVWNGAERIQSVGLPLLPSTDPRERL